MIRVLLLAGCITLLTLQNHPKSPPDASDTWVKNRAFRLLPLHT